MSDRRITSAAEIEACRRKRRFATQREADDAAYQARMEGRELAIYECIWCRGWHLTSRKG
jgi:hypothetical protein